MLWVTGEAWVVDGGYQGMLIQVFGDSERRGTLTFYSDLKGAHPS
jgi:hypothetical protein